MPVYVGSRRSLILRDNNRAWNKGASISADFTKADTIGFVDTHAGVNYPLASSGLYTPIAANQLTRSDLGLLTVPSRTNLCTRSQEFDDNTAWTKTNATITANALASPDGTVTADTLVEDTTSNQHSVNNLNVVYANATVYAGSVYAKAGTNNLIQLTFGSTAFSGVGYANFNLTTGQVVGSGGTLVSSAIEYIGNGWYRCSIVATSTAAVTAGFQVNQINSAADTRGATYLGSSRTVYLWQAQVEAGTFPAQIIPTTTVAVTIAGNQMALTGLTSQLSIGFAGLIMIDALQAGAGTIRTFSFDDGTANNRVQLTRAATGTTMFVTVAGALQSTSISFKGTQALTGIEIYAFCATTSYLRGQQFGQALSPLSTPPLWPVMDRLVPNGTAATASANQYAYIKKLAIEYLGANDNPASKLDYWINQMPAALAA